MNNKVSVIIPSRKERYLDKTIEEIQKKFIDDFEIIVILDGADSNRIDGVKYIYNKKAKGMRTSINQGVKLVTGRYIMKLDAHCMIDKEIDRKLKENHQDKWIQIPTRKRLDAKHWCFLDYKGPDVNYMQWNKDFIGIKAGTKNRSVDLQSKLLDETETFQGSCYFIEKSFFEQIGLLDDVNFAGSGNEASELALKVRYCGGMVIRNKKTWYAHARVSRKYSIDRTKSREAIKQLAKKYGYRTN